MRELIEMRKRIVSGTLPADELSRISHQVADLVDYGNQLLDLDLNLRNEDNCQPADVRSLSAVQVFEMVGFYNHVNCLYAKLFGIFQLIELFFEVAA